MITTEELAEIIIRHAPEHVDVDDMEQLVKDINDALRDGDPDARAVQNMVEAIWQHGYEQGRITFVAGASSIG